MATTVSNVSRRAILGAAAAVPALVALPAAAAIAAIPADRSAWDRAFAAYEKAKAEDEAYDAIFNPVYDQWKAEVEAIPHRTFGPDLYIGRATISTEDRVQIATVRKRVEDADNGKITCAPGHAMEKHLELCREIVAFDDARQAQVKAIEDRLNWQELNDKWEAVGQAAYEAECEVLDTPAPDLPALLFKLEKLLHADEDGSTSPWCEQKVAQTMADARRLLGGEA